MYGKSVVVPGFDVEHTLNELQGPKKLVRNIALAMVGERYDTLGS